jgi:hypothetical protein
LGSAGTATLIQRSRKIALPKSAGLEGLSVVRSGFEYSYKVPESWREDSAEALQPLRFLAMELGPLLKQLTGTVVIRRLDKIDILQKCEIFFEQEP